MTDCELLQLFPRKDIASCEPYTPVIREWCDAGDEFCDRGNSTKVHAGYFGRYMGAAAEFVVGRYNTTLPEVPEPTVSQPAASAKPEGSKSGAGRLAAPGVGLVVASGLLVMPILWGWVGL